MFAPLCPPPCRTIEPPDLEVALEDPLINRYPLQHLHIGSIEIKKAWELAQLLGISSHDEESVLSGLRKSKRILLLEGKGE